MQDVQDVKNAAESIEHWHCTIDEVQAKIRNIEEAINRGRCSVVYFDFCYDGIYLGYDYADVTIKPEDIIHKCGTVPDNVLMLHSALGKFELKE